MAFDGIVTRAIAFELDRALRGSKVEKVYQPEKDELVLQVHTRERKYRLYLSSNNNHPGAYLTEDQITNPPQPSAFCMLMRKHLVSAYIDGIAQKDSERILEINFGTKDEMGFQRPLQLIIEIMGKHSNIILVDPKERKIIDSIKRLSLDVNRARQVLPGGRYEYPPRQNKIPFDHADAEFLEARTGQPDKLLSDIMGISPLISREIADNPVQELPALLHRLEAIKTEEPCGRAIGDGVEPAVYLREDGVPADFHVVPIREYEHQYRKVSFDTVSETISYYYTNRTISNRIQQKASDLSKSVQAMIKKLRLKKQKLGEDLIRAENADKYRVYGELLTANLHTFETGAKKVTLINYYNNEEVTIPLDERYAPAKNAQIYFKKYAKSKTALKEKTKQLEETDADLAYLEATAAFIEQAPDTDTIDAIRSELTEAGYLKKRKQDRLQKKKKLTPYEYTTTHGLTVFAGHNNTENDKLTFRTASRTDLWFHTKDIPGSHVILCTEGKNEDDESIFEDIIEAASIAGYHSKGRDSENVPVDYTEVRYVKKPNGAKPGMCIFTHNRTIYATPKLPDRESEGK